MRITKWVDMGADVEVHIDASDVAAALAEAFEHVTREMSSTTIRLRCM